MDSISTYRQNFLSKLFIWDDTEVLEIPKLYFVPSFLVICEFRYIVAAKHWLFLIDIWAPKILKSPEFKKFEHVSSVEIALKDFFFNYISIWNLFRKYICYERRVSSRVLRILKGFKA